MEEGMSQKEALRKIHYALIAAQDSGGGGLFKFLQDQVDILSDFAGLRLYKMILARWPSYAATGTLDLDKNARWLLGRLSPHQWKIKIKPSELIQSFREGTGRLGHLPEGVHRTLHDLLNSSMSGWAEKEEWDHEAQMKVTFYHFPPLEEAKEIFAAKHGEPVWPETDEVAMVEVRRAEAEAASAEAEERRIHAGLNDVINDYRFAANPVRRRIHEAEKDYRARMESADRAEAREAEAEFKRVTAEDQSTLNALNARFSEQRRRLDAAEELLREDEAWPPEQDA